MLFKDVKLGVEEGSDIDAGITVKFKEEAEIPEPYYMEDFSMDLDTLKGIILSNKKNLDEMHVFGNFNPEIFALATLSDSFSYKTYMSELEITKNDNIAEIKYGDIRVSVNEDMPSIPFTFSKIFLNFSEREDLLSIKELFPYIFKEKFETDLSGNPRNLIVNTYTEGITFEFSDGVTAKRTIEDLSEFYTVSAFHKKALSVKAGKLWSNFYAKAQKENAEIILNYDNNNISFKVEDTEFTLKNGTLKRVHGNMEDYKFKKIINALLEQVQLNVKESIQDIAEHFKEDKEYLNIVKNVKNIKINK
ncbi:MAG: hypothetical protein HXM49_01675 [Leptotrichia sp.]|nr:hypothetical protein [Leptotrichia sp.]